MTQKDFSSFVETVQTVDFDSSDTRATAHTSAVFASDWNRVERALADAEESVEG